MTSPDSPISQRRFAHLLDQHGPEPERWPPALRAGAAQLLAVSDRARAMQAQSRRLFACLAEGSETLEVSARLKARVAEIPLRYPRAPLHGSWPFGSWYQPALGLAASLAAGLILGLGWPAVQRAPEAEAAQSAMLTDAVGEDEVDEEWQELAALAFGGAWLEGE